MTQARAGRAPVRIALLIPEFPGQTHNFFWREIAHLEGQGASILIYSTRRPPSRLRSTSWYEEAVARTTYLVPLPPTGVLAALWQLVSAGPGRWWQLGRGILDAETMRSPARLRLLGLAFVAARLAALCESDRVDHLHVHSCADAAQIALFMHMLTRRPYSMTLHGPLGDYGANQAAKWRNARFQIVITQALKRAVLDTLPCVNERYLYVAPMGIDPLCFSRSRPYLPYAPGQPLEIFSCARLNRAKGHAVLFEVIAMLRKGGLDVRLTVAGEDDAGGSGYRSDLERMVTERGLSAVVTLLGAVSEERVRAELERCHIFALLSDAEPLGVAYMEAMSMEIPVLGTRAGGVPELIQDGIHGILVAPRDAAGAHDAILRMIGEPQAMIRMGLKARGRVIEGFSSSHSARTLLAACGETLSESRSAS